MFVADVIITVITINNLTKRVKLMNDIAKKIHSVSDEVGERIYDGANDIMKRALRYTTVKTYRKFVKIWTI